MKNHHVITLSLLFLTALLFASTGVVIKFLLRELTPFTVAFFRFAIASVCILPFFLRYKKRTFNFSLLPILLLSTINVAFFAIGIAKTIPNAAGIIYTGSPLIVLLISHFFLGEPISKRTVFGIIIGLIGTLSILILPLIRSNELLFGSTIGNLIVFIACLSWSGYTAGSRYLSSHHKNTYSPFYLMQLSIFQSTFILFFCMMATTPVSAIAKAFTLTNLLLLAYLGIVATVAAYIFFQWLIKHASATTASLNTYIQSPLGFLLAWMILGDQLSWEFIVGTAITFCGVYLATSGGISKKDLSTILPQE